MSTTMNDEVCEECGIDLEDGQIGLCDDCQELEDIDRCENCGVPLTPDEGDLCEDCIEPEVDQEMLDANDRTLDENR